MPFALKSRNVEAVTLYPQGRDTAILDLLATAKKTVLIRTDRIEMCEVATAIVRLAQDGVSITLEVPNMTSRYFDGPIIQAINDCGVTCRIGLDSAEGYRGTLIVVDGRNTLYSASNLTYAPENCSRPYILGRVKNGHDS
jgi:hypothetical protein